MKRTGIFALAAGCAIGATALVGGVGYASALDVAEQSGRALDVGGVSTVPASTVRVADRSVPTPEATDPAVDDSATGSTDASGDDDGTADQGSGDVDVVSPSAPVDIEHGDENCDDSSGRHAETSDDAQRSGDHGGWGGRDGGGRGEAGHGGGRGGGGHH